MEQIDIQSQKEDPQKLDVPQIWGQKSARHIRGKKAKKQQPQKEKNLHNMNEYQIKNLRNGTMLLQSKLQVMKERKYTPNKSKVHQNNHTSYLIQLKEELLTSKLIRAALNVDSGMSNHPTLRLKLFSLGCISFQLPFLQIRMERSSRMENHQVRNFRLSTDRCLAPKVKVIHSKEVLIFKEVQPREYQIMSY
ncbi:MAG: hypothetical protein EZS28_028141 [Streblomastix strix]|uniref:Uncharacterized protein n=1 Tax=Streblomastix strix TaxID=222440 RepID=A0A5J4V0S7_9EUKA|nr:MAG: hypothetical protein EZS28_028141 [Streblomastix strix]